MSRWHTQGGKLLRPSRWVATFIAAVWFACTGAAAAVNLSTTFTDLWWNPTESGWGVNIDHQNQLMYLTFYIYRADGSPYWVTALLNYVPGSQFTFTGDLYENPHGPWFGTPVYAPIPAGRKAGTATFSSSDGVKATLKYDVDGVQVNKNIERFFLQNLDFSGIYYAMWGYATDSCTPPALNGQLLKDFGTMTITQQGASLQISLVGAASNCTLIGTYMQAGLVAFALGNYTCTDGTGGSFNLNFMQTTVSGMTAQLRGNTPQCHLKGGIAGILQ